MSRATITPFLQPGRKTWSVFVVDCEGRRGNKSLRTQDRIEALALCAELDGMMRRQLAPLDPALSLVSPVAYELFYGVEKPAFGVPADKATPFDRLAAANALSELAALRAEVEHLRAFRDKYAALASSIEGRRIEASRRSPTLAACAATYAKDCEGLSAKQASAHRLFLRNFTAHVGAETRLADVTAQQIHEFLQQDAAANSDPRRAIRMRAIVSRLFTWAARVHGIPSPMDQVPKNRAEALRDIQWHSIEEVEAAIADLPTYWRAVVGCMAFAGLSAHEVRGLQMADLQTVKGRQMLRVSPTDERGLKTAARVRSVAVSARLSPLLAAHVAELADDSTGLLFPSLAETGGAWKAEYFSFCLRQWLPAGMNALSLRRTFGSLLIRSGRSAEEVAAAMGNSADIVRRHYGRILGGEVDLDF